MHKRESIGAKAKHPTKTVTFRGQLTTKTHLQLQTPPDSRNIVRKNRTKNSWALHRIRNERFSFHSCCRNVPMANIMTDNIFHAQQQAVIIVADHERLPHDFSQDETHSCETFSNRCGSAGTFPIEMNRCWHAPDSNGMNNSRVWASWCLLIVCCCWC